MSKRTPIFNLLGMESGDIWYPGYDQNNMLTTENQLSALINFVGSGVLSGWDVTQMFVSTSNAIYATTISEQQALIQAYSNTSTQYSFLGRQFANLNLVSTIPAALVATDTNINFSAAPDIVDGNYLSTNDRVLATGQSDTTANGMYIVQTVGTGDNGIWVRSVDLNTSNSLVPNMIFQVNSGDTYGLTLWALKPINANTTAYILGTDPINFYNPWTQVIRVTPGSGVIAPYAASTTNTYYFRFISTNVYYVWAQSTLSLPTQGLATIVAPQVPQVDYNTQNSATYLATVEVSQTSITDGVGSGVFYISGITYESNRNDLFELAGSLQQALQTVFYPHQHLGGPNHPSKIDLSSNVILEAPIMQADGLPSNGAPIGSTIYLLYEIGSTSVFTWSAATYDTVEANPDAVWYGLPSVYINDILQDQTTYTLTPSSGKIYLKNSLKPTDTLNVILPKTFQIILSAQDTSLSISLDAPTLFLTDGVEAYDSNGNPVGPRLFAWNGAVYHTPIVSVDNTIQSPTTYTFTPSNGSITFLSNVLSSGNIAASAVSVLIQRIGIQIQGELSGTRLSNINASTFDKGIVDQSRIVGLDHVGQLIVQEPTNIIPNRRLLAAGDHKTFYPEILTVSNTPSPMQYATETIWSGTSVNISPSILVGTKRGLLNTSDGTTYIASSAWDIDNGEPCFFMDNLCRAGGSNHFNTTYMITKQGYLYQTINGGLSWSPTKLPVDTGGNTILVTCIYASTQIIEEFTPLQSYRYSTLLYLGTEQGLYTANIADQETADNWIWTAASYAKNEKVWAIQEMVTLHESCNDGGCTESYDRTLYIGSDSGLYVDGALLPSDPVKGFLWLTNGNAQNDLLWYTDTTANISHTAQYVDLETIDSSTTYWVHPLSNFSGSTNSFTSGQLANANTIVLTNINLSGGAPNIIDGYNLVNDCRVVVAGQTDSTQNGIYFVSVVGTGNNGTWLRDNSGLLNGEGYINSNVWVTVVNGTVWHDSTWLISLGATPASLGTTSIGWTMQIMRAATISNDVFTYAYEQTSMTNYYMLSDNQIILIQENVTVTQEPYGTPTLVVWTPPTIIDKAWDATSQGNPRAIVSTSTGYLAHSTRGVWFTSNGGASWVRTPTPLSDSFVDADNPTLYDESTLQPYTEPWTKTAWRQSYDFSFELPVWQSLLYEKEYKSYFTSPWNPAGATVVIYVNGATTTEQYTLNPANGNIIFSSSLAPQDVVTITIVRLGVFISDVGNTPHQELSQTLLIESTPVTYLVNDMAVTDMTITVANPTTIPVDTTILQLSSALSTELIYVTVNPTTRAITLVTPRTGTLILPKIATNVYLVSIGSSLGIQDIISLAQTNQTYDMNSLAGVNTIQLSIALKNLFPDLFTDFSGTPNPDFISTADLGPDNSLFVDFSDPTAIDPIASAATLSIGVNPSSTDNPEQPHTVYSTYPTNANANGSGMYVGTDQGIWLYTSTNNRWTQDSNLDGASVVYFIQAVGNLLYAGTSNGLYTKDTSELINTWKKSSIYYENLYNYLTCTCFGESLEAFSKSDGLAVVLTNTTVTPSTFISDSYTPLDGIPVHSTHYDQFFRVDSNGGQSQVDCLYVCSDVGLYALISGSPSGQFSSFLTGLEAFGPNPNTEVITTANGGTQTISIKYYQILKSDRPKAFLFHILTNNGIYRVRDWRWLDPAASLDTIQYFTYEAQFLAGMSCTCSAKYTYTDTNDNITYKMFVGTDQGMYRTYNEGNDSWDRCERIGDLNTPVYSISVVNTGLGVYGTSLLVGTPLGLWATDDDGDTWYQPITASESQDVIFDGNVTSGYLCGANPYLAQTFTPTTGMGQYPQVVKVSLYLDRDEVASGDPSLGNTITAQIYHADPTTGIPTVITDAASGITIPTGGEEILASDVTSPGFWTVYTPANLYTTSQYGDSSYDPTTQKFTVVITENIAVGGRPIIRWLRSELNSPYIDHTYTSPDAEIWTLIPNVDFYFNVIMLAPPVPILSAVNVGFAPDSTAAAPGFFGGEFNGLVVDDNGVLTTDMKLACSIVVDDSVSMTWADPGASRLQEIPNIISSLFAPYLTSITVNEVSFLYSPSFANFMIFGVEEENRSGGFVNNVENLDLLGAALFSNGKNSALFDSCNVSISSLQPQSIVDAIVLPGSDNISIATTQINMTNLVTYLIDRNILRLVDIQSWFGQQVTKSQWDGETAMDIPLYRDVSMFVAQQWAKNFLPIAVIVSDADDSNSGTAAQIAITANNAWADEGAKVFTYMLGTSDYESNFRGVSSQCPGKLFNVTQLTPTEDNDWTTTDWYTATNSLMIGQANNVFSGSWSREYDYEIPTFIDTVYSTYTVPYEGTASGAVAASCSVQIRYSTDRVNFTPWITLPNVYPYQDTTHRINTTSVSVNQLILDLQYKVTMSDGWDGTNPIRPHMSLLYHNQVFPGTQVVLTPPINTNGMMFEYILSASANIPSTANVEWGVARGNTTDFTQFEPIINGRKACLPNREQGLEFTPLISELGLTTKTTDNITFQVYNSSGGATSWASTDVVTVYINSIAVDKTRPNYSIDNTHGIIVFPGGEPPGVVVTCDIVTPQEMYVSRGEPTTTSDYRTYLAANGSWPIDSTIIVLVNNAIKRGGYWLSANNGSITFFTERQTTDLVTVFVQPSNVFRVGAKVSNYSSTPVTLNNFGLFYTTQTNLPLQYEYANSPKPSLVGPPTLGNSSNTIYSRLEVNYTFLSQDGNEENGTQITWWKKHGVNPFVEIISANGLPDYTNRTVERLDDLGPSGLFVAGDQCYVTVKPSDGLTVGNPVNSNIVTMISTQIPWVGSVTVSATGLTTNALGTYTVPAGNAIKITYIFTDLDSAPDQSTATFYNKDASTPLQIATIAPAPAILAANMTLPGQLINCTILPYNGSLYGTLVVSPDIIIT